MRKTLFFLAIVVLCSSCNIDDDSSGFVDAARLSIFILDTDGNNRLDPQSPAFWGDEFIQGMKLEVFGFVEGGTIWAINDRRYPFIVLITGSYRDDIGDIYSYIRYPDGSYDQIRTRSLYLSSRNGGVVFTYKVWVNGELAFNANYRNQDISEIGRWQHFFNLTFFPELELIGGIDPAPSSLGLDSPLVITR